MTELLIILGFINLEVEVGAVIVDYLCVSFLYCRAVFEETALDIIGFFRHDRQCAVNIMQLKRWLFNEALGLFEAVHL